MIYWGRCECLLKMKWKEAALGRESPRPHADLINSSPTISGELPKKNACNRVPCEAETAWLQSFGRAQLLAAGSLGRMWPPLCGGGRGMLRGLSANCAFPNLAAPSFLTREPSSPSPWLLGMANCFSMCFLNCTSISETTFLKRIQVPTRVVKGFRLEDGGSQNMEAGQGHSIAISHLG